MASSPIGTEIPEATLVEVPYTPESDDPKACAGPPKKINTRQDLKGKKVVIVAVPGCFTPSCHGNHIPPYLANAKKFAEKGYEVYVIAANDAFVMNGWRTALGGKGDIHFANDLDLELTKGLNATLDASKMGLGTRAQRYACIVDDLKIKSLDIEASPGDVTVSSAETILGKL